MTTHSYDVTDYTAVACPVCKSPIGVTCTVRNGPRDRTTHLARQDRAVRAERRRAAAAPTFSGTHQWPTPRSSGHPHTAAETNPKKEHR